MESRRRPQALLHSDAAQARHRENGQMTTHWLYPVNPDSDYFLLLRDGSEVPVSAENLWMSVSSEEGSADPWYLSTGFRTMQPNDWVWIYVAGRQEICAVGQAQQIYQETTRGDWSVDVLWDRPATAALSRAPIPRALFGQIPFAPARANPKTVRTLDSWLAKKGLPKPGAPLDEPPEDLADARRRVQAEVVRRQGQGRFRDGLRRAHGDCCAATGNAPPEVLEAAHVDPYLGPQSNRPDNGLLLRADIHTLFDLHLLAIDQKRRWVVSPLLKGTEYARLSGQRLKQAKSHEVSLKRLARHQALFRT